LIGIILTKITEGDTSSLVQRLRFPKENISWYLFPLLLPYCIVALTYLLNRSAGDNFSINLLAILPNLLTGLSAGLIEEFGWRGFALPRLQKKHNPLVASIILGFFWGLWYLVGSYWAVGSSFGKIFPIYFIVSAVVPMISYSILMTWLFNKTKSNLVLAILFHTAISASVSTFLPLSGDTKTDTLMYLIYAVIVSVVAFVFVFADPKMFRKVSQQ
jgi:membrane protease YdiL (CAAX protease family)